MSSCRFFLLISYLYILGPLHTARERESYGKRSFNFTVRPTVYTNQLQRWNISKTSLKPEKFKNVGFEFSCGLKTCWERCFSKTMTSQQSRDFADRNFIKHKSKMTGYCCIFKFLWSSVDGNHLLRFQSENTSNWSCVVLDGAFN